MVAWVETLGYEEAGDRLKEIYKEASSQIGEVHNLYRAHSLRPETIDGSDRLYKAVLHCADNTLAPWLGELVATYVAALNLCHYAFVNHGANFRHHLGDPERAARIMEALPDGIPVKELDEKSLALLEYTRSLTLQPGKMAREDLERLREVGFTDGEIIEANQICAGFNYWTRTLNGLGVELDSWAGLYGSKEFP